MKDYDITIQYHPGKANVMADALSRKSGGTMATLITRQARILRDLEEMQVEVWVIDSSNTRYQLNQVSIQFDLYDKIKEGQHRDEKHLEGGWIGVNANLTIFLNNYEWMMQRSLKNKTKSRIPGEGFWTPSSWFF